MSTPPPDQTPGRAGGNGLPPEAVAMIGCKGDVIEAPEPVDRSTIRRFAQAIMDDDPLYWNAEYARGTRYQRVMAPPLFPLHAMRRPGGSGDPLERVFEDPDYDGAGDVLARLGLPRIPISQTGLLNGGNEVRVSSLAGAGDVIVSQSTIHDIFEKHGRSGTLVFVQVDTEYWVKQTSTPLLHSKQTFIWR